MKLRNDSPFARLTEAQAEQLLELSKGMSVEDLVGALKKAPEPIVCSVAAMRKYLRRLRQEEIIEASEESVESVIRLAKQGPELREATLAAMRQRMFESALETNNREALLEMFAALNGEKAKEQAAALEERKIKVLEENAKIGWRKLECENARAGLKALPKVREILMDTARDAEDRISAALQWMGRDVAGLLPDRTGEAMSAPAQTA